MKHEKKVEVLAMGRIALIAFIVFTALFDTPALAQDTKHVAVTDETCAGFVYERKEVSRPAKITLPDVGMSKEALAKGQKVQLTTPRQSRRSQHKRLVQANRIDL